MDARVTAALAPRSEGIALPGLTLRAAVDGDGDRVVGLVRDVWGEYPGKVLDAARDMPELLAPASAYVSWDGRFWVVEAGDAIVGTIALKPSKPGILELQKLYVAKAMRRRGLGARLCGLVEDEARLRGAHTVELWSDIKLLDAHRLYEGLGYERGTELKRYDDTSSTVRLYYWKAIAPAEEYGPVRTLPGLGRHAARAAE